MQSSSQPTDQPTMQPTFQPSDESTILFSHHLNHLTHP
jgi:hypothetical protein